MRQAILWSTIFSVLGATSLVRAADAPSLRAGAAAVDVSPKEFPINMPGGFNANMAEGVNDPLFARALVLDDGTTTLAAVVVDNLGVAQETCDEAKALASQRCGIAVDKILVSSTHTHSGPPSNVKQGPPPEMAYRALLVAGIAEAVVRAKAALRPAKVSAGAHPLPEEVFNRRWFLKPGKMPPNPFGRMDQVKMNPGTSADVLDRPAGPTDPDITVLSVEDAASRKPLAIWASYSLHYVGGTPKGLMSADYFGEFARLMRARVGGDDTFVAMMSNGTSGDINNIPFLVTRPPRETFEQIRIIAGKAADAVWHARAAMPRPRSDVPLGMLQRQVTLKLRRPTPEQIEAAKAVLATTDPGARDKLPPLAEAYARRTLSLAEAGETLTVGLQALRIGDLAVCAIPFETFVEIGLDLKKRSPFARTMVLGVSNGYNGYLPTPEQHKLGGYETWLGTNKVQEDASVILCDNLLEMLGELNRPTVGSDARK
jgi:neutral ceramidase